MRRWKHPQAWQAYLLVGLAVTGVYTLLPVQPPAVSLLVLVSPIPAIMVALRTSVRGERLPWLLLLSAMLVLNVGNGLYRLRVLPVVELIFDISGTVLAFVTAATIVMRRGRRDHGGLIDSVIVSAVVGVLLWDLLILPRLGFGGAEWGLQTYTFISVFALAGVLGALARLMVTSRRPTRPIDGEVSATPNPPSPVPPLWLLIFGLSFAMVSVLLFALVDQPRTQLAPTLTAMIAYLDVGAFALHPGTKELMRPGPAPEDILTPARLVFLGMALAALPVVGGGRALVGRPVDPFLLLALAVIITPLVMLRIGQLASERSQAVQALRHEATHDHLTGLVNRREFMAQIAEELRMRRSCMLVFVDLDGFKAINDRYGHAAGDRLLVEVAGRLLTSTRRNDLVGRLGGDEFVILLRETGSAHAQQIVSRIADALSEPVEVAGMPMPVGASLGIASSGFPEPTPGGYLLAQDLLRAADHAMYRAKRRASADAGVRVEGLRPTA